MLSRSWLWMKEAERRVPGPGHSEQTLCCAYNKSTVIRPGPLLWWVVLHIIGVAVRDHSRRNNNNDGIIASRSIDRLELTLAHEPSSVDQIDRAIDWLMGEAK